MKSPGSEATQVLPLVTGSAGPTNADICSNPAGLANVIDGCRRHPVQGLPRASSSSV